jgi:hypothetical protein
MKNSKGKTAAILIAVFLMTSIGASTTLMPIANAHVPSQQLTTNAYITAFPTTVGTGQTTLIYMWLNRVFGFYPAGEITGSINYAAVNNNYRFHNYQLTITDPDGQNTTKTFDVIQDATSSQSYSFTPTIVGTYTLSFNFPGQAYAQYAGQYNPTSVLVNDTYLPSSATTTLTVQADPIPTFPPSYPLPEEYWTRPIFGENPFWWTIASNWLGTGAPGYGGFVPSYNLGGNGAVFYAGDSVGPETSHVMWTKPLQTGGIVGGNKFDNIPGNQYFEGSAYNQRYQNPIVVNGKIFYTEPLSFTGPNSGPAVCVDLRTGQKLWSRTDVPPLSFALIWDHEDPNQHGVYPAILSTANFGRLFDADTGAPLFNVTGVPTGTAVLGPSGEHLRYVFTNLGTTANPNWVLAQWNSTKLWNFGTNPYTNGSLLSPSIINQTALGGLNTNTGKTNTDASLQGLITTFPIPLTGTTETLSNYTTLFTNVNSLTVPFGSTLIVNGGVLDSSSPQNRFDWNYSVSWRNSMPAPGVTGAPTVVGAIRGDIMLIYNGTLPSQGATFMGTLGFLPYTYFAINLNASRGTIGSVLWSKNYNPPAGNLTVLEAGIDPVNRVFVEDLRETQTYVGYDLDTGNYKWTTKPQADMDYYGSQASGSLANTFAYGRLYSSAYAGIVYCYDTITGNRLWTYGNGGKGNTTDSGFEVPGPYPTFVNAIGNGIVYTVTSEHTVELPVFKGALSRALNATTGEELWTIPSYVTEFTTTSYAIADGFATWFNSYDNSIYTVGRGPSAITVTAPTLASAFGAPVVIQGSVTDIAAGTKQNEQAARFPNGVPAMSDASMTDWMGYVYQQKPKPTNAVGIEVILSVLDSNNNTHEIGRATSDSNGFYRLTWTPDIPGDYTVYATFAGTNSYWPSQAEAAFTVMEAPVVPPPAEQPPPSMTDTYVAAFGIAILIAVIVGFAAAIVILRKRQ